MFTEMFGFSGASKPIDHVILNDPETDLSEYTESGEEIEVSNDLMQEMVFATNRELSKKTGLCTYMKRHPSKNIRIKVLDKKYIGVCSWRLNTKGSR
jgi:hypothetical protein